MARRRREILMQLESEGVLTLNKELSMPMLPQRVAVVSAAGAAGYGDFCDQLMHNPYGFVSYHVRNRLKEHVHRRTVTIYLRPLLNHHLIATVYLNQLHMGIAPRRYQHLPRQYLVTGFGFFYYYITFII